MKTEISTEVSYQVQNQDKFSDRWFFASTTTTNKNLADNELNRMRETYSDIVFRMLCITTTTEVIG